jgi:hypothetical protein
VVALNLPMGQVVDGVVVGVGLGEGVNHPPLLWRTEAGVLKEPLETGKEHKEGG